MENEAEVAPWERGVLHVSQHSQGNGHIPIQARSSRATQQPRKYPRGLLRKRGHLPPQVKRYSSSVKTTMNTTPLLES